MEIYNRREWIRHVLTLLAALSVPQWAFASAPGNFTQIYGDPEWRDKFFSFLRTVYNIYPEQKFHELITEISKKYSDDQEIYSELLRRIPEIKPFLSEFTYAIPALKVQKKEMARQTAELLTGTKEINGYIEIGTPGRYVEAIDDQIRLKGRTVLVHDREPGFSPMDILERGRFAKVGEYVALDNYGPWPVPEQSAEVITCFIGLHHSPREKIDGFVKSIWKTLKPGGRFILRDHDADSEKMTALVALAHDVFNAGLGLPWKGNTTELRYFKPLSWIDSYLASNGFARSGPSLYQADDPTKNALVLYKKIT